MGFHRGPKTITDGLTLYLDAANQKGISPLGNNLFNGANQLAKNLISPNDLVQAINGVYLGNLSYYTVFAIDYPESSYGGDAAGRNGITPGLNVRSGSKIFGYGRALHYSVYDNITKSWVKHTTYDSYVGTGPVDTFVSEYATAVANYPNAIHVVSGSHRDSYHTTAQYDILKDLGAPSNVDSIIGFSSPEWILVGKPGLGAGKAYGWVFQNYTTDTSQVAHLNFGLPVYGSESNYFSFDGVDDYFQTTISGTYPEITFEFWGFFDDPTLSTTSRNESAFGDWNSNRCHFGTRWSVGMHWNVNNSWVNIPNTNLKYGWNHYTLVYNTNTNQKLVYLNGILSSTETTNGNMVLGDFKIGVATSLNAYYRGNISIFKQYDRALSSNEVEKNYNATKTRFGL
jgi:hypothetical protein